MTDSWKVLLDSVPSVVAELIVAIRVVVAAKLVSANEISPTDATAREKRVRIVLSLIFLGHQLRGVCRQLCLFLSVLQLSLKARTLVNLLFFR